jgi:hypothetical protein
MWSAPRSYPGNYSRYGVMVSALEYKDQRREDSGETRVEAGSNTSTVTLRVVRGDEKGSLESETVKYGLEFQGTRTRERMRWQGPAAYTKDRSVLSSDRAPHIKKDRNCQIVIAKYLVMSPRWGSTPRLTD